MSTDQAAANVPERTPAGDRLGAMPGRRLLATITGLATPVVLGQLSQVLMGLVDTIMVGRLGEASLAAVAVATLMFSALAMSIKATDVAAQTFTARRVGEGREGEVGAVLATALAVVSVAGALFMLVGLLWPGFLMRLVNSDPEVHAIGVRVDSSGCFPLLLPLKF